MPSPWFVLEHNLVGLVINDHASLSHLGDQIKWKSFIPLFIVNQMKVDCLSLKASGGDWLRHLLRRCFGVTITKPEAVVRR